MWHGRIGMTKCTFDRIKKSSYFESYSIAAETGSLNSVYTPSLLYGVEAVKLNKKIETQSGAFEVWKSVRRIPWTERKTYKEYIK